MPQAWSLAIEEQFYLFVPLIAMIVALGVPMIPAGVLGPVEVDVGLAALHHYTFDVGVALAILLLLYSKGAFVWLGKPMSSRFFIPLPSFPIRSA